MEVLTAFVREQSKIEHEKLPATTKQTTGIEKPTKPLRADIQAALTVIGRRKWWYKESLFQHIDLRGSSLVGAYLVHAILKESVLYKANLERAILIEANLLGASLGDTILISANLHGAKLNGATLRGADLSGANLSGTHLIGTHLIGTTLIGTNFSGTNLSQTNFGEDTNLAWEQLSVALIDETTKLPPHLEERRRQEQENAAEASPHE